MILVELVEELGDMLVDESVDELVEELGDMSVEELGDDFEELEEDLGVFGIDFDLLFDGIMTPWPVPDPTPVPPIDGLHNPEPEPTPPTPCCIDPDLELLAPDAIDPT